MDKIGSKMDQKGLKIPKTPFFAIFFLDHTLCEDIILKAWEEAPQIILPWVCSAHNASNTSNESNTSASLNSF